MNGVPPNLEAKDRLGLEIIALVTNPPEAMFNEMQEIPDKTMAAAIQKLIAQGANINIQDDNLLTPLHHIINSGSDIVFEAFLENNPDVNLADDSLETPLFYAIKAQNPLMVKLLLKHQADPNVRNIFQRTPLHEIVRAHHLVNESTERTCTEIVELLLEYGTDITMVNNRNETPLELALFHSHVFTSFNIIKLILQYGARWGTYSEEDVISYITTYPKLAALGGIEEYPKQKLLKMDFKD